MKDAGYAHMGVGRASGKDKAETAANMAISSPLLETAINGAKGVIINITSSPDIGLDEVETASAMIAAQADKEANIIWGAASTRIWRMRCPLPLSPLALLPTIPICLSLRS